MSTTSSVLIMTVALLICFSFYEWSTSYDNNLVANHIGSFDGKVIAVAPYQATSCGFGSCNNLAFEKLTISFANYHNVSISVACSAYHVGDTIEVTHDNLGWYIDTYSSFYLAGC